MVGDSDWAVSVRRPRSVGREGERGARGPDGPMGEANGIKVGYNLVSMGAEEAKAPC